MTHQSHDNECSLLANVSGHNSCKIESNSNNKNAESTKKTNLNCNNNNSSVNKHLNFARVSLKTIKNKIKLNASYSLTLLQQSRDVIDSNLNDTIIFNSNSIDNNKILIKSKSITGCMNEIEGNSISPNESHLDEANAASDEKKSANVTVIPSSSSSTSNENNNEITSTINGSKNDERKLLNVNLKRNTNPFLTDAGNESRCQRNLESRDDANTQSSGKSSDENGKLKNPAQGDDSDEQFCNSEIFGEGEKHAKRKRKNLTTNESEMVIKSSIPTCKFHRTDYQKPCDEQLEKREKKFSKKSGHLFNIASFGRMTPSLKHVNLHYPNKTSNTHSFDASNGDKKYLTKAKYQLIKLGQKCKILTHHPSSTSSTLHPSRHIRTTIIKTNSNHRKKYQYYNEINKSYQLDDFIRSTHLYNNNTIDNSMSRENENSATLAYNAENSNCNGVVYKSYKSEIDLTRNLTYLDAFLNERFERESTLRERPHKMRKNINYSGGNVEQQLQQKAMINDEIFDESIDECDEGQKKQQQQQFYDGNVTSSSFEYTKVRKKVTEKSNTTSSSMSSSDYASVYSGGSKEGRSETKSKLISTPEESIEYYDTNVIRQRKQKRLRNGRRSSQPIPEHTNTYQDGEEENFLLFDDANFVELKNSMKKLHPDLYNSVPHFEDLNSIDFYDNSEIPLGYFDDGNEGGETLINPYAKMEASPSNKSYIDERGLFHENYLDHFQQQLQNHDDIEVNEFTLKNHLASSKFRPRAMTSNSRLNLNEKSLLGTREAYYNPAASTNDLHDGGVGRASGKYGYPHRVIVSKSKRQKGEVVLEYEC